MSGRIIKGGAGGVVGPAVGIEEFKIFLLGHRFACVGSRRGCEQDFGEAPGEIAEQSGKWPAAGTIRLLSADH